MLKLNIVQSNIKVWFMNKDQILAKGSFIIKGVIAASGVAASIFGALSKGIGAFQNFFQFFKPKSTENEDEKVITQESLELALKLVMSLRDANRDDTDTESEVAKFFGIMENKIQGIDDKTNVVNHELDKTKKSLDLLVSTIEITKSADAQASSQEDALILLLNSVKNSHDRQTVINIINNLPTDEADAILRKVSDSLQKPIEEQISKQEADHSQILLGEFNPHDMA